MFKDECSSRNRLHLSTLRSATSRGGTNPSAERTPAVGKYRCCGCFFQSINHCIIEENAHVRKWNLINIVFHVKHRYGLRDKSEETYHKSRKGKKVRFLIDDRYSKIVLASILKKIMWKTVIKNKYSLKKHTYLHFVPTSAKWLFVRNLASCSGTNTSAWLMSKVLKNQRCRYFIHHCTIEKMCV